MVGNRDRYQFHRKRERKKERERYYGVDIYIKKITVADNRNNV